MAGMLTGDVRRFKAGPSGVELEFWEHETESIRESLEEGTPGFEFEAGPNHLMELAYLVPITKVAPVGAILEGYGQIEAALADLVEELSGTIPTSTGE